MRATALLLALACAGCSAAVTRSPPPPPPSVQRTALPSGFPVIDGAVPMPLAHDDPGLIALWESDRLGSSAYDFYAVALPAAGYRVIGLYPGGEVALIRFQAAGGAVWQIVVHGAPDGRVAIEVRLDRP
jgi:hypothetical protein